MTGKKTGFLECSLVILYERIKGEFDGVGGNGLGYKRQDAKCRSQESGNRIQQTEDMRQHARCMIHDS